MGMQLARTTWSYAVPGLGYPKPVSAGIVATIWLIRHGFLATPVASVPLAPAEVQKIPERRLRLTVTQWRVGSSPSIRLVGRTERTSFLRSGSIPRHRPP